jgi:hypothetical protein
MMLPSAEHGSYCALRVFGSMAKIFISYRRDDSAYATGVIRDQLATQLTDCEIFLDVDSIPYGVDFRRHLEASVSACDFLVAVIGKSWLRVVDIQGQRRIDNPDDAVRVEVETALRRDIPLIPVFLDGMAVPSADEFPDAIRGLVGRNAIFVRPPPDFNSDVARLVQHFRRNLEPLDVPAERQPAEPQPAGHSPADADRARAVVAPQQAPLPPHFSRGKLLLAAAALFACGALGAWWLSRTGASPLQYELAESYFFEDSNFTPDRWQPHSRMLDGGFTMPVEYVHWVILVKHPPNIAPIAIPLECRLLDKDGEVVRFAGITGELPDPESPGAGESKWLLTLGSRHPQWKPGTYTVQLETPTKSTSASFEVYPAEAAK